MIWDTLSKARGDIELVVRDDDELWRASRAGASGARDLLARRAEPSKERVSVPPFWQHLKLELFDLLCLKSAKYAKVRDEIDTADRTTRTWFLPMIAAAVGAYVGVEPAILLPFVALGILGALKVGKEVWCARGRARFEAGR
jgi:hypothetical protein